MNKIAIFASGNGSNAENIVNYFRKSNGAEVSLILTNKENAFVLERAKKLEIKSVIFSRHEFLNTEDVLLILKNHKIDWVVLAGFLLKIPQYLITSFPNKIINIHPALLPKYGGKGMYGENVHKAVIDAKELESGITIHHVNENYDEGKIIFQAKCLIDSQDTAEDLATKIHELEHKYFPEVIKDTILSSDLTNK